jgi:hypothetical protein
MLAARPQIEKSKLEAAARKQLSVNERIGMHRAFLRFETYRRLFPTEAQDDLEMQ